MGSNAMKLNTTGASNVAIGTSCLESNTTASSNTAVGQAAMNSNTTGDNNVGVGKNALLDNTTGTYNTATGYFALGNNTTASYNTAFGGRSLQTNTTGASNVAMGYEALKANTTGYSNTGVGYRSLLAVTTGVINVAVGQDAGKQITTGTNNICIGQDAGTSNSPSHLVTVGNRIVLGNNSITHAHIKVDWTVTSDARDKMNFASVPHGLSFVNDLQPVKFDFKKSRDNATPHGKTKYGFKAQDVLALEGDNPIIIDNENEDTLSITNSHLIPVLVKAIQELSTKNDALEARITALEA
jgi:hypothetical protein